MQSATAFDKSARIRNHTILPSPDLFLKMSHRQASFSYPEKYRAHKLFHMNNLFLSQKLMWFSPAIFMSFHFFVFCVWLVGLMTLRITTSDDSVDSLEHYKQNERHPERTGEDEYKIPRNTQLPFVWQINRKFKCHSRWLLPSSS
jgi:hypothetical protein